MKRMSSQETTSITPEKKSSKKPNYTLRRAVGASVATLVLAAGVGGFAAGKERAKSYPRPQANTPNLLSDTVDSPQPQASETQDGTLQLPDYMSQDIIDKNVFNIVLEKGARIRSEPAVTEGADSNILVETTDDEINIRTRNGVARYHDVNGEWYGIPATAIEGVTGLKPNADSDGTVWINEQRAETYEEKL